MARWHKPVVGLGLALGLSCGGEGGAERGAGSGQAASQRGNVPGQASCSGTLTGPVPGAFTCMAMANYYDAGGSVLAGRHNSLVTVLNNPFDPKHTRPKGVKVLGFNIELTGEPKAGTYGAGDAGPSTMAHVTYDDDRQLDEIKSMTLTLTAVTFWRQEDALGIKSKTYRVSGSLDATLGGGDEEVRVTVSF